MENLRFSQETLDDIFGDIDEEHKPSPGLANELDDEDLLGPDFVPNKATSINLVDPQGAMMAKAIDRFGKKSRQGSEGARKGGRTGPCDGCRLDERRKSENNVVVLL